MFGRKRKIYNPIKGISLVTEKTIRRLHDTIIAGSEQKYCLEIGLNEKSTDCVTVDLGDGADITGDIRGSFAQHGGYEPVNSIEMLPVDYFFIIKMVHTIEHVEWIYQQVMFDWLYTLVKPGYYIYIDTPNLDNIIKIYNSNVKLFSEGKPLNYSYSDHPDFSANEIKENFIPWINYKLFSGCSPGDYHHTCLNAVWLSQLLVKSGFVNIKIYGGDTLLAIANRPEEDI